MMNVGKFIRARRIELGLTMVDVANAVNVGKSTVKKWEDGDISNMRRDKLSDLAKVLNINPISLITGDFSNISEKADETHKIPVYENIRSAFENLPIDGIIGCVPMPIKGADEAENTVCINIKGDNSMFPKIESGDTIRVHKQPQIDSGDIAVVLINGRDWEVKRVIYDTNYTELQSINPLYPPTRFNWEEAKNVKVFGKVNMIIKRL